MAKCEHPKEYRTIWYGKEFCEKCGNQVED